MSSGVARANATRPSWQEKLHEHCKLAHLQGPIFTLVSDRRGGRTAWSSSVTVQGMQFQARYFYDGQYTNNAKEDAAEVALNALNSHANASTVSTRQGQLYAHGQRK